MSPALIAGIGVVAALALAGGILWCIGKVCGDEDVQSLLDSQP